MKYPEGFVTCKVCNWYKHDPKYKSCWNCLPKEIKEDNENRTEGKPRKTH